MHDNDYVDRRHDVPVRVEILDTQTGERRWVPPFDEPPSYSTHYWTEGNGCCDCNRRLQFIDDWSSPCTSVRFRIVNVDPLLDGYLIDDFNSKYI